MRGMGKSGLRVFRSWKFKPGSFFLKPTDNRRRRGPFPRWKGTLEFWYSIRKGKFSHFVGYLFDVSDTRADARQLEWSVGEMEELPLATLAAGFAC